MDENEALVDYASFETCYDVSVGDESSTIPPLTTTVNEPNDLQNAQEPIVNSFHEPNKQF